MRNSARILAVALLLTAALFSAPAAMGQDYGKLMTKKLVGALGKDTLRGYTISSYPLDNFGLLTAYKDSPSKGTFLCSTWTCLGANFRTVPTNPDDLMYVFWNNVQYADLGTGGDLNLQDDEKRSLGVSALFPALLKVLDLNASYDSSSDITTTLDMGPVTVRHILPDPVSDYLNSLPPGRQEAKAFQKGELVMVYSDIVAKNFTLTIKVNRSRNAALDAKLNQALSGKVGSVIGSGSDLGFKVGSAGNGTYTLTSAKPLVLAVLLKRQPEKAEIDAAMDSDVLATEMEHPGAAKKAKPAAKPERVNFKDWSTLYDEFDNRQNPVTAKTVPLQ